MTMTTISNYDDVIDSRDVIARIEELEGERYQACIMLAETDCADDTDETETGEQDNG